MVLLCTKNNVIAGNDGADGSANGPEEGETVAVDQDQNDDTADIDLDFTKQKKKKKKKPFR